MLIEDLLCTVGVFIRSKTENAKEMKTMKVHPENESRQNVIVS